YHLREAKGSSGHGNFSGEGEVNAKPYHCHVPGCKKAYRTVNGLRYHQQNGHNAQPSTSPSSQTNPPSQQQIMTAAIQQMQMHPSQQQQQQSMLNLQQQQNQHYRIQQQREKWQMNNPM
ncbi:hypothetical protein A0J61_11646, partial [Choanephora cucurbitarum]